VKTDEIKSCRCTFQTVINNSIFEPRRLVVGVANNDANGNCVSEGIQINQKSNLATGLIAGFNGFVQIFLSVGQGNERGYKKETDLFSKNKSVSVPF
jgi:hypothetical protein